MKCPNCQSGFYVRIRRKLLQKLLPNSKRYFCMNCRGSYLKCSFLSKSRYLF